MGSAPAAAAGGADCAPPPAAGCRSRLAGQARGSRGPAAAGGTPYFRDLGRVDSDQYSRKNSSLLIPAWVKIVDSKPLSRLFLSGITVLCPVTTFTSLWWLPFVLTCLKLRFVRYFIRSMDDTIGSFDTFYAPTATRLNALGCSGSRYRHMASAMLRNASSSLAPSVMAPLSSTHWATMRPSSPGLSATL